MPKFIPVTLWGLINHMPLSAPMYVNINMIVDIGPTDISTMVDNTAIKQGFKCMLTTTDGTSLVKGTPEEIVAMVESLS